MTDQNGGDEFAERSARALDGNLAKEGPKLARQNKLFVRERAAIEDPAERAEFVEARRREYEGDVDLYRLASELVIDAVVPFEGLRDELIARFASADPDDREAVQKRHGIHPG